MMRSESKEVKHKYYHPASLAAAFAVSLPSRPNELDSLQKAPPYGNGKPDVPVYVHHIRSFYDPF
jgi:hypothetical protein